MDISEKLLQMTVNQNENTKISKIITELSTKKFELQKSLKATETLVDIKQHELDSIKTDIIKLSCELPIWESKVKIAKNCLENLVREVVEQDEMIDKAQTNLWTSINDWIMDEAGSLQKNVFAEIQRNKCVDSEEKLKEERMEKIKLEGRFEAMKTFEKYQLRKIVEIRQIKDLLDNFDKI